MSLTTKAGAKTCWKSCCPNFQSLICANRRYDAVKKGYVERIQSTTDKREYRLRPTQKYIDYYNISYSYLHLVMERAKQRFSPDDLAKLEEMLQVVSDELMPEIQLPK